MKKCKDCVHFDACANFWYSEFDSTGSKEETKAKRAEQEPCDVFSDKDLHFNFPCKLGDVVWCVLTDKDWGYDYRSEFDGANVYQGTVIQFKVVRKNGNPEWFAIIMVGLCLQIWSFDFSEKVFFSQADAEAKLHEIQSKKET